MAADFEYPMLITATELERLQRQDAALVVERALTDTLAAALQEWSGLSFMDDDDFEGAKRRSVAALSAYQQSRGTP